MKWIKVIGIGLIPIVLIIVLIGILLFSTKVVLWEWEHCYNYSDKELEQIFQARKLEFDKLINMATADKKVIRIDSTFTWLENNYEWPRPDSELGFSKERWQNYKNLFTSLSLKHGLLQKNNSIYLIGSSCGWLGDGSSKGYVYSEKELSPLLSSLDLDNESSFPFKKGYSYKKISDHWYLYYELD